MNWDHIMYYAIIAFIAGIAGSWRRGSRAKAEALKAKRAYFQAKMEQKTCPARTINHNDYDGNGREQE